MWTASCYEDPVNGPASNSDTLIVHATTSIDCLLKTQNEDDSSIILAAFQEGGRPARVALADYCSRKLAEYFRRNLLNTEKDGGKVTLEPLGFACSRHKKNFHYHSSHTPYVLERTDAWSADNEVNIIVRARIKNGSGFSSDEKKMEISNNSHSEVAEAASRILTNLIDSKAQNFVAGAMYFVATVVLQNRLRDKVASLNAVAFVSDGSILPRKSGANEAPMASPPAVPSKAPENSPMSRTLDIEMGSLRNFLTNDNEQNQSSVISIPGMLIPKGITLIAGGGYHGKSTLLRAISAGVYDKVPGDGRETCVTIRDTMALRAEDGRYVNNCNISAFISNLPTPPGVTSTVDTTHFSSNEASGSTSQAANVSEAIELGAKVFLVDEDVSAANFMARDGRMRALVMDESITPLLYRVNGLYQSHGISCIVVVGGVGDWLDVPDQVILLNKYVASDATRKAASISAQFSHGHVQYAGKGVVHQLEWERTGTPAPRRPSESFLDHFNPESTTISLLDGGHAISIHPAETNEDVEMEDVSSKSSSSSIFNDEYDGYIDLSRCEQLLGKKAQLYGCGQCVIWLLREAKRKPGVGVKQLLANLDAAIESKGMLQVFVDNANDKLTLDSVRRIPGWIHLLSVVGHAYRPRKYEVGQALTRMRGITLEHLPRGDEELIAAEQQEAERKKRELQEIWNNRRAKKQGG